MWPDLEETSSWKSRAISRVWWWLPVIAVFELYCGAVASIPPPPPASTAYVNKCCEPHEIMVDNKCQDANEYSVQPWTAKELDGAVRLLPGVPVCGPRQHWPVYHNASDRLRLLKDGTLRHFIVRDPETPDEEVVEDLPGSLFYDYKEGSYCVEKKMDSKTGMSLLFAIVCAPEVTSSWKDADFIMRRIIDPTFHVIGTICYVSVSIIHFVLPQLRDLVGNIIATIGICLAVSQIADMVCIFTEFNSPDTFLIADTVMFISLLGAFLWLNSLGFYIWKTFRSRNVFLRITDGRKYCYYSYYVWTWTITMSAVALFSHFILEIPSETPDHHGFAPRQVALGWLGIAVFFTPVACTIFINIYFYLSTLNIMNHMASYGRIHHKLKYSFETFFKLFLVITLNWMFLLISWLPFNGTYYSYVIVNAFAGPLVLFICVLSQKRVRFLLRKVCCSESCIFPCCRPDHSTDIPEWGEEMMAINR